MKKLLFISLALLASPLCYAQKTITLYGQQLYAPDILGTSGAVWGPRSASNRTVLIKNPVVNTELNKLLGTYYTTANFSETTDLLNILTADREPILDSINFNFYRTAFLTTLDRDGELRVDPKYREFKQRFLAAESNKKKRDILFNDDNTKYREALEQSRYTTYQAPIDIQAFTKLSKTFKAGLGADITADIKQIPGASFGAGLTAAINNVIDKNVTMSGARYHEIKLRPTYVSMAKQILSYYATNPKEINPQSEFTDNLKKFYASSNAAIAVGAAVIESTFTTESMKNLALAIGAAVKANLAVPASADANKIAANAEAKFTRDAVKMIGVKTGQSFYTIRLVYSPDLELGAGSAVSSTGGPK